MSIWPFKCFIPGESGQITPDSSLWSRPLSGNSGNFVKPVPAPDRLPGQAQGAEPTIGDYLTAARTFLEDGEGKLLSLAMEGLGKKGAPIQGVELHLEKHGAFYHPLRVKVFGQTGSPVCFVLNGAVSESGLALIKTEYKLLSRLQTQVSMAYTPRVFAAGICDFNISLGGQRSSMDLDPDPGLGKSQVGFFLGEWFDGFREFHISPQDGGAKIAVWASNGEIQYLSLESASIIYEQIAYVLTIHYNLDTGEQIFPWHHAAGDFVVDIFKDGFPVKLITVRGYSSLMEFDTSTDSDTHVLPSLLIFFLNLTLRIRMDRLDGVGSLAFLGEAVLKAAVTGFLRGLADKLQGKLNSDNQNLSSAPKDRSGLPEVFVSFMAGFSREQIEAILTNLIETWSGKGSEQTMAKTHLKSHSDLVHSLFKNM